MELKKDTLYSIGQIAQWFGLKGKKFSNDSQKNKKLQQLKLFASYELRGNKIKKVFIKQVYQPVYSKQGSKSYQIIKDNYQKYWQDNGKGLDTIERVGEEIYRDGLVPVAKNTTIAYVGKSKREEYGKNYSVGGVKGYSIYSWGKKVQQGNQIILVPLNKEEEEIKNKLIKKYFGNTTEKQIFVQGMVDNGQITKEQAWSLLEELTDMKNSFGAFKAEFETLINNPIGRGTYLIEMKGAF